jgi:hypothetical protein
MALSATTVWEVETGGSDTVGSGAFDPGQTAGMFTDGAATSATSAAPVFTSASYNFVAGDANAWLYIASGTNWTAGWYKISSVASNAATLDATIGHAVLKAPMVPSTATGCATTASPTSATWTIDYSQQNGSQFTYTDLSSTGVGLTASSAGHPFGKQYVGNSIVVTGGTNFTTGRYVLASVAVGVGTFLGAANLHTAAGTDSDGAGRMGGAVASPGQIGAIIIGSNSVFIQSGTYTIASASTNIATGCWAPTVTNVYTEGYQTVRGDRAARPLLQASGISTFTVWATPNNGDHLVVNIGIDGATLTSSKGFSTLRATLYLCSAINCTNSGFVTSGSNLFCSATGCSTAAAFLNGGASYLYGCVAYSNTITGFSYGSSAYFDHCLAYSNSGASSDGFLLNAQVSIAANCVAYANGRDGFHGSTLQGYINCISESNTGVGFTTSSAQSFRVNCATFGNGSVTSGTFTNSAGNLTGSASFFTNAASGDFSLNSTAGAGAILRATGLPGVFPVGLTTGYLDIGAAQHADPAGGGESVAIFGG